MGQIQNFESINNSTNPIQPSDKTEKDKVTASGVLEGHSVSSGIPHASDPLQRIIQNSSQVFEETFENKSARGLLSHLPPEARRQYVEDILIEDTDIANTTHSQEEKEAIAAATQLNTQLNDINTELDNIIPGSSKSTLELTNILQEIFEIHKYLKSVALLLNENKELKELHLEPVERKKRETVLRFKKIATAHQVKVNANFSNLDTPENIVKNTQKLFTPQLYEQLQKIEQESNDNSSSKTTEHQVEDPILEKPEPLIIDPSLSSEQEPVTTPDPEASNWNTASEGIPSPSSTSPEEYTDVDESFTGSPKTSNEDPVVGLPENLTLEEEIEKTTQTITDLEKEKVDLNEAFDKKKETIKTAERSKKEIENKRDNLETDSIKTLIERNKKQIEALEQEIYNKKDDLSKAVKYYDELLNKTEPGELFLKESNASTEAELTELEANLEELESADLEVRLKKAELDDLNTDLNEARSKGTNLRKDLSIQQDILSQCNKDLELQQKIINTNLSQINADTTKLNIIIESLTKANAKKKELQNALTEQETMDRLEQEFIDDE